MRQDIELLDTVALAEDIPERDLKQGEFGTVVEMLAPEVFEVESATTTGKHTPSLLSEKIS